MQKVSIHPPASITSIHHQRPPISVHHQRLPTTVYPPASTTSVHHQRPSPMLTHQRPSPASIYQLPQLPWKRLGCWPQKGNPDNSTYMFTDRSYHVPDLPWKHLFSEIQFCEFNAPVALYCTTSQNKDGSFISYYAKVKITIAKCEICSLGVQMAWS